MEYRILKRIQFTIYDCILGGIMIKAVFFDLDRTLCDSNTAWNTAQRETFHLLCKHYQNISIRRLTKAWTTIHRKLFQQLHAGKCSMANVRDRRFHDLFKELDLPTDNTIEEISDFFCQRYLSSLHLYEDVTVLEMLHAYHTGIITNGAHDEHTDSQLSKVQHLGLCKRIQSLTISDEVGVRKPNIKMFHVACERADVSPKDSMFVGDSIQDDIVGANSVGMTSIYINRKSDLLVPKMGNKHPDHSISNLCDILSYLEEK